VTDACTGIQEVVSPYGLAVDRIIVREGRARENTRCSLVDREDHLILCRLTTEDIGASSTSTALDACQNMATLWSFELSAQRRPVFTRLVLRDGAAPPSTNRLSPLPRLDWKVESISAGELIDKKTFVQRYTVPLVEFRCGDLHFSTTGQLASIVFKAIVAALNYSILALLRVR
jgi:hypothetical protein